MTGEAVPEFPEEFSLEFKRKEMLRYGENPHQKAALYLDPNDDRKGVARARKVQGKELSYNNLLDADAAFECVAEFMELAAVIVKHMNPCGVSVGRTPLDAYKKAFHCDPVSAFGGIVALNRTLDKAVAQEITKLFVEVIIAPDADEPALDVLKTKPNVRVLLSGGMPDPKGSGLTLRLIAGGILVQGRDTNVLDGEPQVVTKRAPTESEMSDMTFAFTVSKHVKSNAIVYAKDGATLGIGAGQMSRIDATRIASHKAQHADLSLKGAVLSSDAFFPFPDVIEEAAKVGATAIIQPGGSKNDQASIDAADKAGIAMVFTGVRHFRH